MDRNRFVYKGWVLEKVQDFSILQDFDCGDEELNEYYHLEVLAHREELLTQTYCFYREGTSQLESVAFVDFCNDAVRLEKTTPQTRDEIPEGKRHYKYFPAVKITRLGVSVEAKGKNVGSFLLETVKHFFLRDNRTGCRFVTVDAYNNERVLNFYVAHNYFELMKVSEAQMKDRIQIPLIFDLKNMTEA